MAVEALKIGGTSQCFCLRTVCRELLLQCNTKLLIENILTSDESFCNLCFAHMIKQLWPKAWWQHRALECFPVAWAVYSCSLTSASLIAPFKVLLNSGVPLLLSKLKLYTLQRERWGCCNLTSLLEELRRFCPSPNFCIKEIENCHCVPSVEHRSSTSFENVSLNPWCLWPVMPKEQQQLEEACWQSGVLGHGCLCSRSELVIKSLSLSPPST